MWAFLDGLSLGTNHSMLLGLLLVSHISEVLVNRWLPGLALTAAFAIAARLLRGVSTSGALAGGLAALVLFIGGGPGAFVVLLVVFSLAWVSTRIGYAHKQRLGTAEKREGRNAGQVLANVGAAAVCAGLSGIHGGELLLVGCSAALAEAAADTVSSECGQVASASARLITTWESVPAGTDGGITASGSLTGVIAAGLVAVTAGFVHLVPWRTVGVIATVGTAGMMADSLLGALLERRRLLGNNAVNLLGTLFAVILALVWARF
jgi:uncharacterized protein (TIGR00297 family)